MDKVKETELLSLVDNYNSASEIIKIEEKKKKSLRDNIVAFVEENGEDDEKGKEITVGDTIVKARIIEGKESIDQSFFENKDYWEEISDNIRILSDEKLASAMEDSTVPFEDVEEATVKAKNTTRLEIKKVK